MGRAGPEMPGADELIPLIEERSPSLAASVPHPWGTPDNTGPGDPAQGETVPWLAPRAVIPRIKEERNVRHDGRSKPMSLAVHEVLNLEQFLKLPEIKPALEFIDGRIVQKVSPTLPHSVLATDLPARINGHVRPRKLGRAFVELRCSFGGQSFVPDV